MTAPFRDCYVKEIQLQAGANGRAIRVSLRTSLFKASLPANQLDHLDPGLGRPPR